MGKVTLPKITKHEPVVSVSVSPSPEAPEEITGRPENVCERCKGEGLISNTQLCDECHGTGKVS